MLIGSMGLEYLRMAKSLHVQLPREPGGVLGQLVGHSAHVAFGFTGATLLLLLLFGLGFSLFFHVSWLQVAERIGGTIEDAFNWFCCATRTVKTAARVKWPPCAATKWWSSNAPSTWKSMWPRRP